MMSLPTPSSSGNPIERLRKHDVANVECIGTTHYGRRLWKFIHLGCVTEQTWTESNLRKALDKDPINTPCSVCGKKRRAKKGLAGYVAKYGRDYNLGEWKQYQRKVRLLSDRVYREHQVLLNPNNLPRGRHTYHLDHKLPIFEGFKRGLEPEFMARVENLQMLPARENLSKGRKVNTKSTGGEHAAQ